MVGCDYTSEAREAIKNGSQTASVLFPLGGTKAVEIAQKIFAKKEVPKHIVIPVKLISKENVMQMEPIF
jgi:ribose transport system substrate-binding protein